MQSPGRPDARRRALPPPWLQLLTATTAFDWTKLIGVPAAVLAFLTLLYFFGLVRPLAVRQARYWHEGEVTRFSCSVKNRSRVYEHTLTGLALVAVPRRLRRLFRRWRTVPQTPTVVPWGSTVQAILNNGIKIAKNDQVVVSGELRSPDGRPARVDTIASRLEARAGSKRSRSKPLQALELDR